MMEGARRLIFQAILIPALAAGCGCAFVHTPVRERYKAELASGPFDAVIVPSFHMMKDGAWHPVTKMRIYWAKHLVDLDVVDQIIFSGGVTRTPYVEAEVMSIYAQAIGIPAERILLETNALNSAENVYFSYRLASDLGYKKLAFASDPIWMRRPKKFAREFKLPVTFLPLNYGTLQRMRAMQKEDPDVDLSPARVENFIPLEQRFTRKECRRIQNGARVRAAIEAESGHPSPPAHEP